MKNILMLGSSHSACFSSIDFSPNFQLSIAANASNGLFRNLQIDENGIMSCKDENRKWNNTVFQKSLNRSSKCVYDYESIILNISCDFNLPMLFSRNESDAQPIDTYSLSLTKKIIDSSFQEDFVDRRSGRNKTKRLISKLRSSGFNGDILLLLTPFDTSFKENQTLEKSQSCTNRKEFILNYVSKKFREIFEVGILLPSSEMIDDCLFIKNIYSATIDSTWKGSKRSNALIQNDTKHKNKKYAQDIVHKNINRILSTT